MTGNNTQTFPETRGTGVPVAGFADGPTGALPGKGDHRAARRRARDLPGAPKSGPGMKGGQGLSKGTLATPSSADASGDFPATAGEVPGGSAGFGSFGGKAGDVPGASDGFAGTAPDASGPSAGLPGAPGDFPGVPRAGRGGDIPEPPGRKAVVRDPWGESGGAGQTHDPHEVTVQLDAISVQGDQLVEGAPVGDGEGSEGPVFVDESGRRSRRYRRIGMVVGLACAVYAVVIVITLLSGNSNAPWLPVTGPKDDTPAGKVDTSPLPADPAEPAASAGVIPGTTPTVSGGVTPTPGASATAPGVGASPAKPGASVAPSATATKPGADPSVSTGPSTAPSQSVEPPPVSPDPPASSPPEPSVAPSESTGGGSAGPGTVADGPASPAPVASETGAAPAAPAAPSDAPISPSPEHIL
ncbi:hypothetical protein ABZ896_33490 [Streptomyces sp. NPDC047072]|uniref:hypothetical protein n=1 Tax=Streptomyces sp. NPDC047072 TaxID=3154809 RepID=UPI0033FADD23